MAQVSFFLTIIRLSPRTSRLTFQKMDFNLLDMMVYVISAHLANYNNTYLPTYTTTLTYIPIFEKKSQKFNIWPVLEPCFSSIFFLGK